MDWTSEREQALVELAFAREKTATQIAVALSAQFNIYLTRSAVIGKLSRMGIVLTELEPKRPHNSRGGSSFNNFPAYKRGQQREPKPEPEPEMQEPEMPEPPVEASQAYGPVPFIERRADQCSFPLWPDTQRTGMICGQPVPVEAQFKFCAEHTRRCLTPRRA